MTPSAVGNEPAPSDSTALSAGLWARPRQAHLRTASWVKEHIDLANHQQVTDFTLAAIETHAASALTILLPSLPQENHRFLCETAARAGCRAVFDILFPDPSILSKETNTFLFRAHLDVAVLNDQADVVQWFWTSCPAPTGTWSATAACSSKPPSPSPPPPKTAKK